LTSDHLIMVKFDRNKSCLWPIFNDMLKVNDYCRWWRYKIHYALDLYHLRVLTYKIFATDTSDISDVLTTSIIRTMSKQCTRNWIKIQELVGKGRTLAKPMGKGVGGSSDDQWEPEISPSNIPFYLIHHYIVYYETRWHLNFSWWWVWRWPSTGMLHNVLWYKLSSVSEVLTASIIRVMALMIKAVINLNISQFVLE
jgi:hypothetical protein